LVLLNREKCVRRSFLNYGLIFHIFALIAWTFLFFYGIKTIFTFGYDEGVYLQTAFQHAAGQKLYAELFLSQPPFFVELLSLLIKMFGNNQVVARLIILPFGILIFIFTFLIAKELFDKKTALISVALLAGTFFFSKWSKELNADIPSLSFSISAIFYAIKFNKYGKAKYIITSSIFYAVAIGFKLLEIFFIFTITYLVFAKSINTRLSGNEYLNPGKSAIFKSFIFLIIFGAVFISITFLWALNYDLNALKSQVLGFGSSDVFKINIRRAGRYFGSIYIADQISLFFLIIFGLYGLFVRNKSIFYFFIVLIVSQMLFHILMSRWLWPHHLIVLFPVFSIVAASYIKYSLFNYSNQTNNKQNKNLLLVKALCVILISGFIFQNLYHDISYLRKHCRDYTPEEKQLIEIIQKYTTKYQLVVSDVQMATFLTGRFTDPNLVDTSYKRIATGNLQSSYIIDRSENVKLVIFWLKKLSLLNDYYEFVKTHYNLIFKKDYREIYLKE